MCAYQARYQLNHLPSCKMLICVCLMGSAFLVMSKSLPNFKSLQVFVELPFVSNFPLFAAILLIFLSPSST